MRLTRRVSVLRTEWNEFTEQLGSPPEGDAARLAEPSRVLPRELVEDIKRLLEFERPADPDDFMSVLFRL